MIKNTIGQFEYEIDDSNVIRAWDLENPNTDANNAPFLLQDIQPNGQPWPDMETAKTWIENLIADLIKSRQQSLVSSPEQTSGTQNANPVSPSA